MQILPLDVARCHGLRDAYSQRVLPVEMCQHCRRYLDAHKRGPETMVLSIAATVTSSGPALTPVLICRDRIASAV